MPIKRRGYRMALLFGAGPEWDGFGTGLIMGAGDSLERAQNVLPSPSVKENGKKLRVIKKVAKTKKTRKKTLRFK